MFQAPMGRFHLELFISNNKLITHNVQGLDIRSSEDYAQNKIESEKLFSSYTP